MAGLLAVVVAYPCFRFRITGHYFVLVTLALSGIVLQVITATRDWTGGSLGYTPNRAPSGKGLWALQFDDKITWDLIARGILGGALERRRRSGRGGRQRHRREAEDHPDLGADDGAGRRHLLPVPDVHLARH